MEKHKGPIKVTITCPETEKVLSETILRDDYAVITAGRRYVKSIQQWGQTHTYHIAYDTQPAPAEGKKS